MTCFQWYHQFPSSNHHHFWICSQIQSCGPISSIKSSQNVECYHSFYSPRVQVRAVWFRGSVLMFHVKYLRFFPSITSIVKMILFCQFLSYKSGIRTKILYWIPLLSYPIIAVGRKAVVVAQLRSDYYRITTIIHKEKVVFLGIIKLFTPVFWAKTNTTTVFISKWIYFYLLSISPYVKYWCCFGCFVFHLVVMLYIVWKEAINIKPLKFEILRTSMMTHHKKAKH